MQHLWSAEHRIRLWRRLWLALAEAQQRLGLEISDRALEEMRAHLDDIDFERARHHEQRFRHDVVAHIHTFGEQAPAARPFLHLGATSAFVTDNADLIVMREALRLLLGRLVAVLNALSAFSKRHRDVPTVAYTHFQPAQFTTVGKRASLWLYDFYLETQAIHDLANALPFRGCKGTTGTQASFLELFHGNREKVRELDRAVTAAFDFSASVPVSGQTYTRKIDTRVLDVLSGVGQSASKFATDLRLLQHERELFEPVEREQVGSSAMPYKRNPMRAERVCSLARHLFALQSNAVGTAATQWLERTLDDSANRRLTLPEAFLTADAVLVLCTNISAGLEIDEATIARNVSHVMPFIATERWLMLGVEAGGDRQALHEAIRKHSRDVTAAMGRGAENDLLDRLSTDPSFAKLDISRLRAELDPNLYIGLSSQQVLDFVDGPVKRLLKSLRKYHAPDEAVVTL